MKTQILTAFLLLFTSLAYSQELLVGNTVSINRNKISKKLLKLDSNDVKLVTHIFENSELGISDMYIMGSYPIFLIAGDAKVKPDHLQVYQYDFDNSYRSLKPKYRTSVIKTFGNFKALIIHNEARGSKKGAINFFCVNNTDEKCMNGYLEYPIAERSKAKRLVEELLNNAEFK